mmetsp:Transcript_57988/g.173069  ORF Transcript_57988/g.173069 Transcript_57988/m.173069 type:complete len:248 (-) Transcript_57988:266-1009(-)
MEAHPFLFRDLAKLTSSSLGCIASTTAILTAAWGTTSKVSTTPSTVAQSMRKQALSTQSPMAVVTLSTSSALDTLQITSVSMSSPPSSLRESTPRTTADAPAATASLIRSDEPEKTTGHGPGKLPIANSCSLAKTASFSTSDVHTAAAFSFLNCIERVSCSKAVKLGVFFVPAFSSYSKQTVNTLDGFFKTTFSAPLAVPKLVVAEIDILIAPIRDISFDLEKLSCPWLLIDGRKEDDGWNAAEYEA